MRAAVTWDDYSWVAVLEGGGVTQAKRLDQLPARLVDHQGDRSSGTMERA